MEINLHLIRLGKYVRDKRKSLKMNQIEFYRDLFPERDLNDENIKKKMNAIENGKGKEMNYELLFRLHEKYDVSLDYLFGFETEYPNYANKAASNYTGLKPETIKQLHFWSKYLSIDTQELELYIKNKQYKKYSTEMDRIREAKWIYAIINMLFQPKSQDDVKDGISDLSILYDIYMLSLNQTEKVVGLPLEIINSELSWDEIGFNRIELDSESLYFSDSMNGTYKINIHELNRKIWEERLLKDIELMVTSINSNE